MMGAAFGSEPSTFCMLSFITPSSFFYELEPKLQPRLKYVDKFSPLKDGETTLSEEISFLNDPVEKRPCQPRQFFSGLLNETERNLCIL